MQSCKRYWNDESRSALVESDSCIETFEAIVDDPVFKVQPTDEQEKVFADAIQLDKDLVEFLRKWCKRSSDLTLKVATLIDEARK